MSEAEVLRLIREDMDRAEAAMYDILDRAFFSSERPLFASFYSQPPSRLKRWSSSVRWYFVGIWNALLGRTFDDDYS